MQDPGRNIGFLLKDVSRALRRDFDRRAKAHGLSLAQWQALALLARDEGVNQVTLAERLEIQPITLARLIDRLQEAGLVTRQPDPADRRAFRLYLTEAAQPLIAQMWAYAAETRAAAMAGLSDADRDTLIRSLQHMQQNLQDAEGPTGDAATETEEHHRNVVRTA